MGNQKILLHEEGKPTDSAAYARQMQSLRTCLQTMANPDDPKAKAAYAKFQKRMRERAQFVDAASEAYTLKWVGARNMEWARTATSIALDPNPKFQPQSMFQAAFAHTTAKLWVDRQADSDRSRRSPRDERYFLRRGHPGKTLSRQRGFDGSRRKSRRASGCRRTTTTISRAGNFCFPSTSTRSST